ncbi:MAG: hypothetical protein K1W13_01255 [Lachnospiraceae bacterium]
MLKILSIKNTVKKNYNNCYRYRYFYTRTEITFNDIVSVPQKEKLISDFKISSSVAFEEYKVLDAFVKNNKIQLIISIPYLYVNMMGIYYLSYHSDSGIHSLNEGILYELEPIPLDSRSMTPCVNFLECAEVDDWYYSDYNFYAMRKYLKYKAYRFESNFFYLKDYYGNKEFYNKKVILRFKLWSEQEQTENLMVQFFGITNLYINGELRYRTLDMKKKLRFIEEIVPCTLEAGVNEIVIFYEPVYFATTDSLNKIVGISVRVLLSDEQNVPILLQDALK